jgi:hypothetical protein
MQLHIVQCTILLAIGCAMEYVEAFSSLFLGKSSPFSLLVGPEHTSQGRNGCSHRIYAMQITCARGTVLISLRGTRSNIHHPPYAKNIQRFQTPPGDINPNVCPSPFRTLLLPFFITFFSFHWQCTALDRFLYEQTLFSGEYKVPLPRSS